jgi:RNA polymerase sigma factor (TIGR02999 family)
MASSGPQVTQLLQAWSEGNQGALEQLMPLVYEELHRLAQRYMAEERPGHTLQATALVNEAYLRLAHSGSGEWRSRAHFFAVSARVMRRILVDWARSRRAMKRGSDIPALELQENLAIVAVKSGNDLIAVDDALETLAALDSRQSQIVEMRFFGGLSVKETAEVLTVSEETVRRDWNVAKSWLRRELNPKASHGK